MFIMDWDLNLGSKELGPNVCASYISVDNMCLGFITLGRALFESNFYYFSSSSHV